MAANSSNTATPAHFETMSVLGAALNDPNPPRTAIVSYITLQHGTLDLALRDLQTDPIITPHVEIGRELLLESATFGMVSIITTPSIQYTTQGVPTIYVTVRSEGPRGHGLDDLRNFWSTIADQAAAAYAAILGTAIERAINLTAHAAQEDAAAAETENVD